jgi:hypothetical protein
VSKNIYNMFSIEEGFDKSSGYEIGLLYYLRVSVFYCIVCKANLILRLRLYLRPRIRALINILRLRPTVKIQ